MARNIKTIELSSSTDGGAAFVPHSVVETPVTAAEMLEEEDCTDFGDEERDRLPTLKDKELFNVKLRDDGDSVIGSIAIGCTCKWRFKVTFSDRACGAGEGTVVRHKQFDAYIQARGSDNVTVDGKRVAVINIALRLKSAMTDVVV